MILWRPQWHLLDKRPHNYHTPDHVGRQFVTPRFLKLHPQYSFYAQAAGLTVKPEVPDCRCIGVIRYLLYYIVYILNSIGYEFIVVYTYHNAPINLPFNRPRNALGYNIVPKPLMDK